MVKVFKDAKKLHYYKKIQRYLFMVKYKACFIPYNHLVIILRLAVVLRYV